MHVALLIPCTSNKRESWKTMKDTYFMTKSLKTFLHTYDKKYDYTFYIGYDKGDRIFSIEKEQDAIKRYTLVFPNIKFRFIEYNNIQKGYVTKMWNVLFQKAYDDGCDYFYQCGDDICFKTNGWVYDSIKTLKHNNDIGLTGPLNNNNRILTQAFISRKHMQIFGWLFPEEIKNWGCDDWYNFVYKPNHFIPLINHFCSNEGGKPRYDVNNDPNHWENYYENTKAIRDNAYKLSQKYKPKIAKYLHNDYGNTHDTPI